MSLLKYCLSTLILFFAIHAGAQEINWMTWEEAAAANSKQPKKIFVDLYTDWCGWCKKMDATTFKDPSVVSLINNSFYAVKLNAEQKESIMWNGEEFKWYPGGRDGVNKLAYDLVDGQLSYPTYVLLDQEYSRILISPGYKAGDVLIKELKFAAEDHYKNTSWEAYKSKS
jgi:thioredoxin-related protein